MLEGRVGREGGALQGWARLGNYREGRGRAWKGGEGRDRKGAAVGVVLVELLL